MQAFRESLLGEREDEFDTNFWAKSISEIDMKCFMCPNIFESWYDIFYTYSIFFGLCPMLVKVFENFELATFQRRHSLPTLSMN